MHGYTLQDALASYKKAIEVEPDCAEGWEELSHYYDAIASDERSARDCWDKAKKLREKNI